MRRGYDNLRGRKYCAEQFDLPLPFERPRERLELPARGSLVRLAVQVGNAGGVWRVASALATPGGGMFIGFEEPTLRGRGARDRRRGACATQQVFEL